MAKQLDAKELVDFKELLLSNSIQVDALCQILIQKGIITGDESFKKLKEVQAEYHTKKAKS